jgi:predicted unusual protein kinase regulating ubiquinone biosynthesis (AarF/ABC1/UbiB family)
MRQLTDRRCGKPHRTSHVIRPEAPPPAAGTFNGNASPEMRAKQARLLLEKLGMGYSCLALYLSSRVDLLPPEFCREFSLTSDSGPPLSASEIQQILEEELPSGLNGVFVQFDFAAVNSTLLTHSLTATLANGAAVEITILRPECRALKDGQPVPQSFDKAIVREYCGSEVTDAVLLDFFTCLRRRCNFTVLMDVMELISYDIAAQGIVLAPRIYRELSKERVMTLERLECTSMDEGLRSRVCNADVLSRRLCQAWLHQALCGNGFAVDLQPHHVAIRDEQVLFTGCDFVSLSSGTKENLWNYIMATMVDDPDKAAMHLLREMCPAQHRKVDAETFRSKFRQAAYFGALEPLLGTNSNALSQLIFQHWKTALEYGYQPKPHLLCFYRGLFSIARISRDLSPFGDPLREGVEEVRNDQIMRQMKDLMEWRYWFRNSDKFANAIVSLPKMIDDALQRASAANETWPEQDEAGGRQTKTGGSTSDMTTICALAAVLFVFRSSAASPLTEKAALLLLLLAGWLALKKFTD